LAAYDVRKPDALVACPACSREQEIAKEKLDSGLWTMGCRCGAVFGFVTPAGFSVYVKREWDTSKAPRPTYVDFVVVEKDAAGTTCAYRWHGWVDADSRRIVQEG
jgi:hypothetical protein